MTLTTLTAQAAHTDASTIVKSANDQRDYAYTELPNGLKLLVISDAEAQRSAAAVDVHVGSSAEPDEFPGLAHFLEHMLFLGTDQYPSSDDYINFINEHGGNHNAFTAFDHTNYYFDVDPAHLHEGLKRFSRFFVAPTLSEEYVKRERNAVDSEYQSKLREDGWRGMDVLKQAVNPKHPYARFSIGNNQTLPNKTVREGLIDFYQQYYSAERMSAVIIGKEDVATLTKWGESLFADVPKQESIDLSIAQGLFDGVKLPVEIRSQSIRNERNLSVYFHIPYKIENEYSKSLGYISYILGYEGQGSLLAALKEQDYASGLYSGAGYRIGDETSFEIGIQLTDKGYANVGNVEAIIFAYIDLLKLDTNGERLYTEIATVSQTAFQFRESREAINEVSGLSTRLNRFPVKDVQVLNATFSGYDHQQIQNYLALMNADNAVIQITAPDIESDNKTKYFNVPYQISSLAPENITTASSDDKMAIDAMHVPLPNPFIADDYELKTGSVTEKHETLANGVELFYKNDTTFRVPRSSVQISLQPSQELSMSDKTSMTLLAALIDEQLISTLYDASIAGVNAEISAGEKSLVISLDGYQQKMPALLHIILQQLNEGSIDKAMFQRVKYDYQQALENAVTKMPYQQTFPYVNVALISDASLPEQRLAALDAIDEVQLAATAKSLLSSLAVRMMVYGNDTYKGATQLGHVVSDELKQTKLDNKWNANTAIVLQDNQSETFEMDHDDNAITYYIQSGEGHSERAKIGLLAKMVESRFFTKLRTELQLGYVVFAYPRPTFNQAGIAFTVQSPVASADELEKHISDFNADYAEQLGQLTEESFASTKTILKGELLQKQENLISAAGIYWADILTTGKTTSSRQAIAHEVDGLKLADFVISMQSMLRDGKKLIVKGVPKKD